MAALQTHLVQFETLRRTTGITRTYNTTGGSAVKRVSSLGDLKTLRKGKRVRLDATMDVGVEDVDMNVHVDVNVNMGVEEVPEVPTWMSPAPGYVYQNWQWWLIGSPR